MAFNRKLISGNMGVGSDAPALYTYLGATADLTAANIQTTNIKPGDTIIVTPAIGTLPVFTTVGSDYVLVTS